MLKMQVFFLPPALVYFGSVWSSFTSLDTSQFTSKGFRPACISAGIRGLLFDPAILPGTSPYCVCPQGHIPL